MPKAIPVLALLMGSIALAGCSSSTKSGSSTTTATASGAIVLKVTGTSPANSVTVTVNAQQSQHQSVHLPYTQTLTNNPAAVGVTGRSGSNQNATITCEIDVPGRAPVKHTATGANAVAACATSPGL
jgi:hypothetical protein